MHNKIHTVIDQIWSLREHSACKDHEILLIGDRTDKAPVFCMLGCKECGYETVEKWVKDNKEYLEKVNAHYYLCPDTIDWPLDYTKCYGQSRALYMGTRIAKNKFVMWSSDDFFYSKDWDKHLFEIINAKEEGRNIYMPWLADVSKINGFSSSWHTRGETISINKEVPYLGDNECYYIFFEDNYVDINKLMTVFKSHGIISSDTITELGGIRQKMHWFPPLFDKSLILPRLPYPNCDIRGWDIFFDNKNGEMGTHKIATKKAFIFQFQNIRPKLGIVSHSGRGVCQLLRTQ